MNNAEPLNQSQESKEDNFGLDSADLGFAGTETENKMFPKP